jgi:electron transfer flavoprotein alpha subunit
LDWFRYEAPEESVTGPIVLCTWDRGRAGVPAGAEEILTLGRKLAAAEGAELNWLVIGELPERVSEIAARHGVAAVERIADARLARFQPDLWVEALAQYCKGESPRLLLFNQSFDSRLVAPRLAGRIGAGVVMNAVGIESDDGELKITASAYGGDTRVVYDVSAAACVVGVTSDALLGQPAAASASPAVRDVPVDLSRVEERICVVQEAKTEGPRLEDAQIVVAGGRGLGSAENFKLVEALAAALGGMAGASRPIVDDGWADSSRQVGLTGKITRPVLYVAAGISGASQHMVGCAAAKTLVAVNRDPDANIFRYATYGVVGDCLEILPEITRAVKEK